MKALIASETSATGKAKIVTALADWTPRELHAGEILIDSAYSSLNFKDALGVTGAGRIFKTLPIIPGIDVSGRVAKSKSKSFQVGDMVLVTGCNLGETHDGGYAPQVIESESSVVKLPGDLTARQAMIYGTAGFTAALCLERMEQNGQVPEMGPIAITGASGGVGQFAVRFFSLAGYEVHAISGKSEFSVRLKQLGATKVLQPSTISSNNPRPLETIEYGGVVDNVGGQLLSSLIPRVNLWGNVACVGLAENPKLESTVMPLILRGVSLLGTSSNNTSRALRDKIWRRLATDLKPNDLDGFVSAEINLGQVVEFAKKMLSRETHGRIIVKISS